MTEQDEIYYRHGASTSLANKVVRYARNKMFEHFLKTMSPDDSTTILDFGVSEFITEEANYLERNYAYPANITAAGIGNGKAFKAAFPDSTYRSIEPNAALPFKDKEFGIAYSNAVFEHLDSDALRSYYFAELNRVARSVYVAVPNRWFPVEHHTGLPMIHYYPKVFRLFTAKTPMEYWSRSENLEFLSMRRTIKNARDAGLDVKSDYVGIRIGALSSNLAVWTNA